MKFRNSVISSLLISYLISNTGSLVATETVIKRNLPDHGWVQVKELNIEPFEPLEESFIRSVNGYALVCVGKVYYNQRKQIIYISFYD